MKSQSFGGITDHVRLIKKEPFEVEWKKNAHLCSLSLWNCSVTPSCTSIYKRAQEEHFHSDDGCTFRQPRHRRLTPIENSSPAKGFSLLVPTADCRALLSGMTQCVQSLTLLSTFHFIFWSGICLCVCKKVWFRRGGRHQQDLWQMNLGTVKHCNDLLVKLKCTYTKNCCGQRMLDTVYISIDSYAVYILKTHYLVTCTFLNLGCPELRDWTQTF